MMEFYKGLVVGLFIGAFAGVFLYGLAQMLGKGDQRNEKLILEQRRKNGEGVSGESADYFDHFNAHRDRRVCLDRRGEPRKTGHPDHRVLHNEHGSLGVSKGPRG
jgi:hypothetical protein